MITKILYIFTRTPLHVGSGSSLGDIDQPVQRERHTRHPIIPGSSTKGAMRAAAGGNGFTPAEIDDTFGPENPDGKNARAGNVAFGEARPLAFPVRSAAGCFAYVTCPLMLTRLQRELNCADLPPLHAPGPQQCFAGDLITISGKNNQRTVVLEEYAFARVGDFPPKWAALLAGLVTDPVWQLAPGRIALLSDEDYSHFVFSCTHMSHQVKIDPRTGAVQNKFLFNLECVPAETLFFSPVTFIGRRGEPGGAYATDSAEKLSSFLVDNPIMQFGGDLTTGHGFCSVKLS